MLRVPRILRLITERSGDTSHLDRSLNISWLLWRDQVRDREGLNEGELSSQLSGTRCELNPSFL